MCYRC